MAGSERRTGGPMVIGSPCWGTGVQAEFQEYSADGNVVYGVLLGDLLVFCDPRDQKATL